METRETSSTEIKDSLSCPSVNKNNISLSISGEEKLFVLEQNQSNDTRHSKSSFDVLKSNLVQELLSKLVLIIRETKN
jgi:hypothetical protein